MSEKRHEVDTLANQRGLESQSACSLNGDLPLALACDQLHQKNSEWTQARDVATASLVTAGVLGAATLATYLLLPGGQRAPSAQRVGWSIAPRWGPGLAGLGVSGAF